MALVFGGIRGYGAALSAACRSRALPGEAFRAPRGSLRRTSRDSSVSASLFAVPSANFSTLSTRACSAPSVACGSAVMSSVLRSVAVRSLYVRGVPENITLFPSCSFSTTSLAVTEKSPKLFRALKAGESTLAAGLPAHLPHPLRGSTAESFTDIIYRWLDVTGVLTRWNNRKEWVLDLVPMNRLGSSAVTEFERKQEMFVTLNAQILALIAIYLAYTGIQHVNVKPPNPSYEGFPGVDGRKKDFTLTNRLFFIEPKERCKECRWLDLECKKECFTRLKAEGYKLFVNGGDPLSTPRTRLEAPHFH